MNRIRFSQWLYIGLLILLTACQSASQSPGNEMLKPGDVIDGMKLTTGAANATPLWAFCPSAQHTGNTAVAYCNVPIISRLAIGHIVMPDDDILNSLDWSKIIWELNIDDHPMDLSSFGTYDSVLPVMPHNSSMIREVFIQKTVWDVVLTNLNPGEHKIQGFAKVGTDSYSWVIHLTIEGSDLDQGIP